jgi:hypothetical protein
MSKQPSLEEAHAKLIGLIAARGREDRYAALLSRWRSSAQAVAAVLLASGTDKYRHGERTKAAIADRPKFSALLKLLRAGLT